MSLTILNSINRITSDFEKGTSDFSSSYDNLGSIFDIANLGANTGDNDSQAKTNNLMKFLEKAMGVIENLANLQASAERKVEKNQKKFQKRYCAFSSFRI